MSELQLWDDNPTTVDLLGLTTIVDTVVAALQPPSPDPVTIGVNAPWGGGKSTVLGLLHEALEREPGFRVIRLDPWEFDDQFDVRGAVIGEVLQDLLTAYPDGQLDVPVNDLLERISWSRVAATMARGQLVAQTDELIKAFTPRARGDAKSLAGFRDEFTKLLQQLEPLKRLIVLVDDLCGPDCRRSTAQCRPRAADGALRPVQPLGHQLRAVRAPGEEERPHRPVGPCTDRTVCLNCQVGTR
ncbi:P-loop NTPase fold protein [Streptomyces griseobrunneus]